MLPKFSGRAFLAPMAGVSDPALRLMCSRMGAGLVVTELTSIHGIVARSNVREFIPFSDEERPLSVQLFGSDLATLELAARLVDPHFDVIDYNMGCPAPHITSQMAGGALLQEASLTRSILQTLVNAARKPVTLKMRAGATYGSRFLFRDIAHIAEDEGVQMITLHPRTVSQGYSGRADWSLIRDLKETCSVPIVGNGDVTTPEDAASMLEQTGCDYVMVGRGAMGNPFLFKQINDYLKTGSYDQYAAHDYLEAFFEYMDIAETYGIRLERIKRQAMQFTRGLRGGRRLRTHIAHAHTLEELRGAMQTIPA